MPPSKGPLWKFYHQGKKPNSNMEAEVDLTQGGYKTACEKAGHVCGKKLAMITHLIGNKPCPYASKEAKKVARIEQGGDADDESEGPSMPAKKRKRIFGKVKESMKQTELKVFKGISILFNDTQETLIWNQFLHATISTNLPFNGPRMLRSDGWKDITKNALAAVNATSYLVDLIKTNKEKKDGASMCAMFGGMINKTEQFQLTLGDYFKESPEVKKMAEEATDLLSWFSNHHPVCSIFDDAQALQNNGKHAIVLSHDDIVAVQVGAKHNAGKCLKLANTANTQSNVIESAEFWNSLQMVVDDIEPICYGTNINQRMWKWLEKWWKALDQLMFIFALILNPYECLDHFGDKAGVNVFSLNTPLMDAQKEKEVSAAFLQYLTVTGIFTEWEKNCSVFESIHGEDPIFIWQQLKGVPEVTELANFATMLLGIVVNQAGYEQDFSDLKIKKTHLHN
ncbi:hypothetical protein L208DRAFT_1377623 [Tricholoma matsutake]|nr:hypothetical protein L208DRAFT_1377623 [Tricholoma matsutake 945]